MPKKPVRPLRARQSFHAGARYVSRGSLVRSDDAVVAGRENLFEDVMDSLGIEQATASPGEKRARKPRAAKKEADDGGDS